MDSSFPYRRMKPAAPELVVRKPNGQRLAVDGESVPLSSYWRRRLAEGSVVDAPVPRKASRRTSVSENPNSDS